MTDDRHTAWKPMRQPKSLVVRWSFTPSDIAKLRAGIQAETMDERWNIYYENDRVHICRSWTGFEIYNFILEQNDASYIVSQVDVEQNSSVYRPADDVEEIERLRTVLTRIAGVIPS